jgi:hypothetical protein
LANLGVVVSLRPLLPVVLGALVVVAGEDELLDDVPPEDEPAEEPQPEISASAATAAGMARHLPICERTLA